MCFEFDKWWHGPLLEMFKGREQTDVVVSAGDHSVAAHRILLSAISPYFRAKSSGKFGAGSQSRQVKRQEQSAGGAAAVAGFAYTGKISLSGSAVVGIMLQMEAVEQAAVDFAGQLAVGDVGRAGRVWGAAAGTGVKHSLGRTGAAWALAALPNGRLASGSADYGMIWNAATGMLLQRKDLLRRTGMVNFPAAD
jgi:hypothetical protein